MDKDAKGLRPSPGLMLLYNNVAELRQIRGAKTILLAFSAAPAKHLDVEIADFLPQSVAVETQEIGRPDLISAGGCQRGRQQRVLDFAQNTVIKPGWRQAVLEARKIGREVPFDRAAEIFISPWLLAADRKCGLRQFRIDHCAGDRLLRVKRRQPARQIFKFANIAGPAMPPEAIEPGLIDLLRRQTFALSLREEVPNEVGNIFGTFAKRRQSQRNDVQPEK